MRNRVLTEIDTALVHDLLNLERHQNREALGGKRSEGVNLPEANRKDRVEPVRLLELQRGHLAHVLSCGREDCLGIQIELLLGICRDNHRHNGKHHALVSGRQIVQELLRLLALELHIIGNDGAEIVVLILLALPVGDIGFNAQQSVLDLAYRFIRRNRDHVDRQHQIPVQLGKLGKHTVFDIARVVFEEQDPCKLFSEFDVVCAPLHAVRADIVSKIVTHSCLLIDVHLEGSLIAGAVKVVKDTQSLYRIECNALGTETREMGCQIRTDSGEIRSRLLNVLLAHGDGHILFLRDAVGSGGLIQEHIVVLHAVTVQSVTLHRHENGILKISLVQPVIVDRDLRSCAAIQAVQKLGVGQEHAFLILSARHHIVDVTESVGLGKLVSDLKDTVRPDALDRDQILHLLRHHELLFILRQDCFDTFNHCLCRPPFPWRRWCPSTPRSRYSPAQT